MKAAVLYAPGDFRVEEAPRPTAGPNEAVVTVRSVGVCGSDLGRIMHTGAHRMPIIPGHEFSGEIKTLPREYRGPLKPGDRIAVVPIIPCRSCPPCQSGNFGLCEHYDYIGSRRNGAMAQEVAVPLENLLAIPPELSFHDGAMLEPAAVTLHGMRISEVSAGDKVCVLGCGTIGLLAVQFAKIMGASFLIASDISPDKRILAMKLGADIAVDPMKDNLEEVVREHTAGLGCDLVVETAGTPQTQRTCPLFARYKGRILLLGTAHREICFDPAVYERILRKELTLTGSWNSYSAPFPGVEWEACIGYTVSGRLQLPPLVSHTVALEELPEMTAAMSRGELSYTKVLADL